jgi:hypothetical protein
MLSSGRSNPLMRLRMLLWGWREAGGCDVGAGIDQQRFRERQE